METRCHRPTVAEQRDHLGGDEKINIGWLKSPHQVAGICWPIWFYGGATGGVDLERRILAEVPTLCSRPITFEHTATRLDSKRRGFGGRRTPNTMRSLFTELKIGLSLLLASG
ncbi:hypothetical protein OPV22_007774 [Ensete ventricosum]|uniref:Uncharacterized protein n=1 Tax=Ensete ventricosum TaxID=4639 RepID=A0AAV8RFH8_ENSVE|nr:hypothetical protein OPV22_007774 [Ensete ventricosum]RWW59602.1 hypothetical protein BHE74_00033466 [Ensete ventricosum]RZS10323.1 hypothetical protein BHM03_00041530 [Ensete ventricosum]